MKNWTDTLTLAATLTLTLAGCAEDGPAASMTEAEPETLDTEHSPETFYKRVMAPLGAGQYAGTPAYRIPQFYRFESEAAKSRFLVEVIGPPSPGWIMGFEAVDSKHPGLAFVDVRL